MPYVAAKTHRRAGRAVAKEGRARRGEQDVPLLFDSAGQKEIPERAKEFCISEQEVIKNVMLKQTVDGEFTTVNDVAETALFWPPLGRALTGQSIVVSHGWFMQ